MSDREVYYITTHEVWDGHGVMVGIHTTLDEADVACKTCIEEHYESDVRDDGYYGYRIYRITIGAKGKGRLAALWTGKGEWKKDKYISHSWVTTGSRQEINNEWDCEQCICSLLSLTRCSDDNREASNDEG